ncbi:winged helix-turn-helix transcriptional regulator [Marinomonas posidonica]|nr:helix-turn-helix domain-containing protein [Marinomonas posidonica]
MTSKKESTQSTEERLCPMPQIAKLIGGKWKLVVLQILIFHGTHRFNELRRKIEGITQAMLTNQLRALEEDGLISRKIYAEVPPRVEYSATQKAMDLNEMFEEMHRWWVKYEG